MSGAVGMAKCAISVRVGADVNLEASLPLSARRAGTSADRPGQRPDVGCELKRERREVSTQFSLVVGLVDARTVMTIALLFDRKPAKFRSI